jgi:hypothetical protein
LGNNYIIDCRFPNTPIHVSKRKSQHEGTQMDFAVTHAFSPSPFILGI